MANFSPPPYTPIIVITIVMRTGMPYACHVSFMPLYVALELAGFILGQQCSPAFCSASRTNFCPFFCSISFSHSQMCIWNSIEMNSIRLQRVLPEKWRYNHLDLVCPQMERIWTKTKLMKKNSYETVEKRKGQLFWIFKYQSVFVFVFLLFFYSSEKKWLCWKGSKITAQHWIH